MSIEDLVENYSYLEEWEDKYRYLIELGEGLSPLPDSFKTDAYKVEGCMSQVWLVPTFENGHYFFKADSDALIVKGLIALILAADDGKTKEEIANVAIEGLFQKLGLNAHLSPTRRNGFFSMVTKIKNL